jgi:hypothetical protein
MRPGTKRNGKLRVFTHRTRLRVNTIEESLKHYRKCFNSFRGNISFFLDLTTTVDVYYLTIVAELGQLCSVIR